MKKAYIFLVLVTLMGLSACSQNTITPPVNDNDINVLGRLTIRISGIGGEVLESSAHFTPTLSSQALQENSNYVSGDFTRQTAETFVVGGTRYINALYTFNNRSSSPTEITLIAVDDATTIGSTPFKRVKAYDGTAMNDNTAGLALGAAKIYNYLAGGLADHPVNGYVSGLDVSGIPAGAGETILTEGFQARNGDLSTGAIPAGATAKVLLSTSFSPAGATDPFAFDITFVVAEEGINNPSLPWINEIHYDNDSFDQNELVEVVVPSGVDISSLKVVAYNGSGGIEYASMALTDASVTSSTSGIYTIYAVPFSSGLQNGAPDGVALCDGNSLVGNGTANAQLLSYEGTFTATNGCASGSSSENIGTESSLTPAGQSLQLKGSGNQYSNFTWEGPITATAAAVNTNQTLQ